MPLLLLCIPDLPPQGKLGAPWVRSSVGHLSTGTTAHTTLKALSHTQFCLGHDVPAPPSPVDTHTCVAFLILGVLMLHGSPYREAARGDKNNKLGALKCSGIHKDSFLPSVLGTLVCASDALPSWSHHVPVQGAR